MGEFGSMLLSFVVFGVLIALGRSAARRQQGRAAEEEFRRLGVFLASGAAPVGEFPLYAADPGARESIKQEDDVETFDYRCERGEEGTIIERRTCAVMPVPVGGAPLSISRHGAIARPVAILPDVMFEAGVFNEQVRVQCADERFARALIDQRMMEWLLLFPAGWGLQVAAGRALAYGPVTKPWERDEVIGMLRDFATHLPSSAASLYPA